MNREARSERHELERAIGQFNEVSGALVHSYWDLGQYVQRLASELGRARSERARELAENERLAERLSLLVASLPGGVVVLGGDGRVTESNPAAESLLGESLPGKLWRDVVARVFAPRPDDGHDISLGNGLRVNISTCSLGLEPGQILLIQDVTETRRLQDQLAHLQRLSAMGEMAAALAHQVRTPLSTALLYAGSLGREGITGAKRHSYAQRLRKVLGHLESLVGDMLTFARCGSLQLEAVDIEQLLAQVSDAATALCAERGACWRLEGDIGELSLQGNRDALVSAIMNLIHNAVEVNSTEVAMAVSQDAATGELIFSVVDDGPGVPSEIEQTLFEPFVSRRNGGTGLGLAVVRAVVEAHGGAVHLAAALDPGSRFELRLPALLSGAALHEEKPGEKS